MLGPAGELGEFDRRAVEPEGERDGDLEGGTRRQAGADRDRGTDVSVESAAAAEFHGDRGDEAPPARFHVLDVGRHHVGRDVDRVGFVVGHETDPIGRCPADLGPAVDGHREDEATGVVGVVADEVHPPGRSGHDPTIHVPIGHVRPRSRAATSAGSTGLKYSSQAVSAAAMNRGTPAERHGDTISMLNHGAVSPSHDVGAW